MAQPSLNDIASSLANRVGQPFNVPLQREIKHIMRYKRATMIHQTLEKYPEQRALFMQEVLIPVALSNPSECSELTIPGKCKILKTTKTVPTPIRTGSVIFDYVGATSGRDSYGQWNTAYADYLKFNIYTKTRPKWYYINQKLFIFNESSDKFIMIRGVFDDVDSVNACGDEKCFTDDLPFPVSGDLLDIMISSILQVELARISPVTEKVDIDNDDNVKGRES